MKANRAFRTSDDIAGAEVVGALILFGLFVTVIALLNLTAVPAAGLSAEDDHYGRTLTNLNALQTEAEAAALPASTGATVARAMDLAPETSTAKDFFSYFLATPARATGELSFVVDYGNITVSHVRQGPTTPVVDIGNLNAKFPYGRLAFDPHPIFRPEGIVQFEDGGIIASATSTQTMRFSPPVTVTLAGSDTIVGIRARVLNGSDFDIGGVAPVRLSFATEAATLNAPASDNARNVTLRLETAFGSAWGAYLNASSAAAFPSACACYSTSVVKGTGGALDVVTWTVEGLQAGNQNDIKLTTALAVYGVTAS